MQAAKTAVNISKIRADYPILHTQVNGKPLVYFDNGATSQKPKQVIDAIVNYYENYNSNVHRGVHTLSQQATDAYEHARENVKNFLQAADSAEIIFTKGTTEGINLVAQTWGRMNLRQGDEVLITAMEHHANIVPWQMICEEKQATLRYIPITEQGELDLSRLDSLINERTKMVAVVYVSNALGIINPVETIIAKAKSVGAKVLIDGAQAVSHFPVNVQALDADFFVFSGHKLFGPTGIGILYGKKDLLDNMIPYQGGGDMIKNVTLEKTTYNVSPFKFEAGTPNIEGAVGLSAAIDYFQALDSEGIEEHEQELLHYATDRLLSIDGLKIYGESSRKVPVVSFLIEGIHPYDLGFILDKNGIAVRTGQHCTQPIMDFFEIPGTVRVSLAFYNTKSEIDFLIETIHRAKKMLL